VHAPIISGSASRCISRRRAVRPAPGALSGYLGGPGIAAVAVSLARFLFSAYLSRGKGRVASGVAAGITGIMLFLLLAFALAAVLLVYAISGFRPV